MIRSQKVFVLLYACLAFIGHVEHLTSRTLELSNNTITTLLNVALVSSLRFSGREQGKADS